LGASKGEKNDQLYGGAGDDAISGLDGNDQIYGGSGDDIISGGSGNDGIYGGDGSDLINGDAGNDRLIGGYGSDTLTGGLGNDRFEYLSLLDSGDVITDFEARDDFMVFKSDAFSIKVAAEVSGVFDVKIAIGSADVGSTGTSIAMADLVVWTGEKGEMDSVDEISSFLAAQNGAEAKGVFVLGYDQAGNVGLYYDSDALSAASGETKLIASLTNLTSTLDSNAPDLGNFLGA
jgi:Ca2+-binding RTX toxin-like protein